MLIAARHTFQSIRILRNSLYSQNVIEEGRFKDLKVVKNPGESSERGAGPLAARVLKENNVEVLLTSEVGPGAKNILQALEIEINLVEQGMTVKEVISSIACITK